MLTVFSQNKKQAFGLFAAAVIWADYVFVMTMFCTAVMVYHNRFEKPPMCGCKVPTPMGPCSCGCCIENCDCSFADPSPTQRALAASTQGEDDRPRDHIEQFFRTKFAPMILNPSATRTLKEASSVLRTKTCPTGSKALKELGRIQTNRTAGWLISSRSSAK